MDLIISIVHFEYYNVRADEYITREVRKVVMRYMYKPLVQLLGTGSFIKEYYLNACVVFSLH